jgi:hypothetical protein
MAGEGFLKTKVSQNKVVSTSIYATVEKLK